VPRAASGSTCSLLPLEPPVDRALDEVLAQREHERVGHRRVEIEASRDPVPSFAAMRT
jgi:hypothetical protein